MLKASAGKYFDDKNIEFVIYTYMYAHIDRLYYGAVADYFDEYYLLNKNKSFLSYMKYISNKSYTVKLFHTRLFIKNKRNLVKFQRYMLYKTYEIVKKSIPDAKFIVLIFDDLKTAGNDDIKYKFLNKIYWNDVEEKYPIQVISTKELVGDILWQDKYKLEYDTAQNPHHPNEKAWEIIVPSLSKRLNL